METRFITLQVPLCGSPKSIREGIEAALFVQGTPLRWAITQLDPAKQTATVEAIVTSSSKSPRR